MCVRKAILLAIEFISIIQDIVVVWYSRLVDLATDLCKDHKHLKIVCAWKITARYGLFLASEPPRFFFSNFSISAFQHFNIPVFLAVVAFSRISVLGKLESLLRLAPH